MHGAKGSQDLLHRYWCLVLTQDALREQRAQPGKLHCHKHQPQTAQGNSVACYWFSCEQTWQIWVRLGKKGVDLGGSSRINKSSVHLDDQSAK